jgi:hypothetical protein
MSLVCLLFDSIRPPYVVKNPKFGHAGGGNVAWEVPWREGTAVRSATGAELLRLLLPTISVPDIEILGGSGHLADKTEEYPRNKVTGVMLEFSISIYIYPRLDQPVAIPFHRCSCILSDIRSGEAFDEFTLTMYRPYTYSSSGGSSDSVTLERTSNELIAHGPGKCRIEVSAVFKDEPAWLTSDQLALRITLFVIGSELPVELNMSLVAGSPSSRQKRQWSIA